MPSPIDVQIGSVSSDIERVLDEWAMRNQPKSGSTIRAPFEGMISHRSIDTGDFVMSAASAAGEPLFTLNRLDRFRIVFDVPESNAASVKIEQKVELRLDSLKEHVFTGKIKRTSGQLDKRTRTLRVEAEVDDRDGRLKVGMYGMILTTIKPQ